MGKRTNTAKWIESAGRWQINVQKDGIRRTFVSSKPGRTGQREANAKADTWLEDGMEPGRRTLSQLFPEYLEGLKLRTGQSHWRKVEQRWNCWCAPVIGRLRPAQLGDAPLQKVITHAYAQGKLSRKTLMNVRSDLTAFVKYLRKCKLTAYRPEDIVIPQGAAAGERRILQPEDLVTLFTVETTLYRGKRIRDPYLNAYRFQVLTGLRPGELIGMTPKDIAGDRVQLQRSVNYYGEVTAGKNDNARRAFLLTPTAKAVVEDQLSRTKGETLFEIQTESHYRKRWKEYCAANGIAYVSPYELRHTFVSVVQSLPEGWVKELVGHSRNMDTFGVYGHELEGRREQIAAGVESIFQNLLHPPR